ENRDKYGRDLIDRSEVALIGGDECLVFISKEHVFKDKKFYAFQHDRADELATGPTDDKWYTWRRYMTDEEAILDKISATDIIDHGEITSELKDETHV
ncbi:type IV secretory system conjugative DNA transfer family protein, partial [Enterococcus faecalis]|nr:type IV secretory system conjugative DNA transfer family protein [Enterococcus faecalis]